MVLTEWDPNRIADRVPLVLAAVGSRRCGKSTSIAHLVYQMYGVFDLVICFVERGLFPDIGGHDGETR